MNRTHHNRFLLAVILLAAAHSVFAVPAELGLPSLTYITPEDYGGTGQNWDIDQDSRGLIYIANGNGIYEYDGVHWRWLEPEQKRTARSVATGPGDIVYAGYHNEFGYFSPDERGSMEYTSLSAQLPDTYKSAFRDIWTTLVYDGHVYFASVNHLFRWPVSDEGPVATEPTVWNASGENRFQAFAAFRGKLYLNQTDVGITELTPADTFHVLPHSNEINLRPIWSIVPYPDDQLLLVGWKGMYLLNSDGCSSFDTPASQSAIDHQGYNCSALGDGLYALGTDYNGVVLFDTTGTIQRLLNRENGMVNDQIKNVPFLDSSGDVWLPLEYGIARIEPESSVQQFDQNLDLEGCPTEIIRCNGRLIAGTTKGLFYLNEPKSTGHPYYFRRVLGPNSVWDLAVLGNHLIVGDEMHIYIFSSVSAAPDTVFERSYPLGIVADEVNGRVYIGTSTGKISSIAYQNGQWIEEQEIIDLKAYINFMTLIDGRLWLTCGFENYYYTSVELDPTSSPPGVKEVKSYSSDNGYAPAAPSKPFQFGGELLFSAENALYKYDAESDTLLLAYDHLLFPLTKNRGINLPTVGPDGDVLWYEDEHGTCRRLHIEDDGSAVTDAIFARMPNGGYNSFFVENGSIWAASAGFNILRYDWTAPEPEHGVNATLIREVMLGGTELLYKSSDQFPLRMDSRDLKSNSLRISYALPVYRRSSQNEYQYRLTGFMDDWSNWTRDTYQQFAGLSPGKYEFEVRGRNPDGRISKTASVAFSVVAPWYATTWAFAGWVLFAFAIMFALLKWRLYRIEMHNRRLDQLVRERTDELERLRETEREAEIKARQMETAYKMAATIAHEFNNPLAIIQASSQLMQDQGLDTVKQREFAQKIPPQVHRMRDLLQKIVRINDFKEIDYAAGMKILDIHHLNGRSDSERQTKLPHRDPD